LAQVSRAGHRSVNRLACRTAGQAAALVARAAAATPTGLIVAR